ncbi:MAG: SusD/RagB family nutrient-binding outer membrane lipoprotein [Balneolales bacterium]
MIALIPLLFVWGCDLGYDELNTNPNEPVEVEPDLLLPGILKQSVDNTVENSMSVGNIVAQHTSKVLFGGNDRYNWQSFSGFWNGNYNTLRNVSDMHRISEENGNDNYRGISLVLKSWLFSQLTDAYGDIPYSDALGAKDNGTNSPAYDQQSDIYQGLLDDLEEANELLDPSGMEVSGDILYDGDILKWQKFANSLSLRLLMRISDKTDVSSDMQEIINNPSTYPVFESVDDNAALTYLSDNPNQFPVYTYRTGTFQEYRASKTLVDELNDIDDPRLNVFAEPTDVSTEAGEPEFVGVPNGLEDDEAANYNGSPGDQSRMGTLYFDEPDAAQGLIMTLAELNFILAEAAQKDIINGDAETYYNDGMEASFEQYDITPDADYFTNPDVAFDQGRALEQIGSQKWISLFFNGLEAWFDWRRTGYPVLEPSARNVNDDQIPVRFRYPTEEQSLNATNYEEALERQGDDNINTEMWLLDN